MIEWLQERLSADLLWAVLMFFAICFAAGVALWWDFATQKKRRDDDDAL